MKQWRYREYQRDVKGERTDARKKYISDLFPPLPALFLFCGLSSCAVDPTLKEQLSGDWVLAEAGFACATDTSEYASFEPLSDAFDDITLEIAGNEARMTRSLGTCEEVFEFTADFSREGKLFLAPSAPISCSGCSENESYCDQTPSDHWLYAITLSEDGESLTLQSLAAQDGFALKCGTLPYDEENNFAAAAQIALTKQ
jgi:hypothetical protein